MVTALKELILFEITVSLAKDLVFVVQVLLQDSVLSLKLINFIHELTLSSTGCLRSSSLVIISLLSANIARCSSSIFVSEFRLHGGVIVLGQIKLSVVIKSHPIIFSDSPLLLFDMEFLFEFGNCLF